LYKMIARITHKHTPENQVNKSIFKEYHVNKTEMTNAVIIDIDAIPKYYSHLKN